MSGFFKWYRKGFDSALWNEARTYSRFEAWFDLVANQAAFVPHPRLIHGRTIHLQIGELIASERFLEERWKWSRTKIRRFISDLKKNHEIDHREDQGQTVLIVCKYKELTAYDNQKEPPKDTTDQTTKEPQKNQREEGKESISLPHTPSPSPTPPETNANTAKAIIDSINPLWTQAGGWSVQEERELHANLRYILDLPPTTIDTLKTYLPKTTDTYHQKYFANRKLFITKLSELAQASLTPKTYEQKTNNQNNTGNHSQPRNPRGRARGLPSRNGKANSQQAASQDNLR